MEAYTTHQAAKLLGVSLPTVVNWIKAGRLEAYRTPGGHRRIPAESIVVFCRSFGLPEPRELRSKGFTSESAKPLIAIASYEYDFAEALKEFLVVKTGFDVDLADTAFRLGLSLSKAPAGILLIDWAHFSITLEEIQAHLPGGFVPLFLCSGAEEARTIREHFPSSQVFVQPMSLEEIHDAIGKNLSRALSSELK